MTNLTIRLPDELHKALKDLASTNRRSLNSEILFALETYIKQGRGEIEHGTTGKVSRMQKTDDTDESASGRQKPRK